MNFKGHFLLTSTTLILLIIGLGATVFANSASMPAIAYSFMLLWLAAAIVFTLVSYREFVCGYLLGLFSMMIGWRIAAMYSLDIATYILFAAFLCLLANFIYCAAKNLYAPDNYQHAIPLAGWQLIFIRLYIGLNFVPHFTEKLFAGSAPHMQDVAAFIHLGVPHADFFVWLAGFCEFGAAITLSLGFMTRLGAIGTILYLAVATFLGHHFTSGFIWAGPGGGWEFAVLWMVLIASFAVTAFHKFSIDQRIEDHFNVPQSIRRWM